MDVSLVLLIANVAWMFVGASKWGRNQFNWIFRLVVAVTLLAFATIYYLVN